MCRELGKGGQILEYNSNLFSCQFGINWTQLASGRIGTSDFLVSYPVLIPQTMLLVHSSKFVCNVTLYLSSEKLLSFIRGSFFRIWCWWHVAVTTTLLVKLQGELQEGNWLHREPSYVHGYLTAPTPCPQVLREFPFIGWRTWAIG